MPTSINGKVADRLAGTGGLDVIVDDVIDILAKREISKRSAAIITAIDLLEKDEKTFRRMNPDALVYDDAGNVLSSGYTKPKLDERNKLAQKIQKMTAAIEKAVVKGDMSDVYNITGKSSKDGGGGDKGSDADSPS